MLAGFLPTAFQPAANNNYYYLKVQGPPGATTADMERTVQSVTTMFRKRPEDRPRLRPGRLEHRQRLRRRQSGADIRDATVTIVLNGNRKLTVTEIKQAVREWPARHPRRPRQPAGRLGHLGSPDHPDLRRRPAAGTHGRPDREGDAEALHRRRSASVLAAQRS
jgi:hypothetical protein